MILDNENEHPKIHEWITSETRNGNLSIVTGYFTIGALAFLSKATNAKIEEYKFILGDIVNFDTTKNRTLDLLNENISIDAALKLNTLAQEAVDFLKLEKVKAKTLEPNFCHAKLFLFKNTNKHPQTDYFISGSSNLTETGIGLKETNNVELNFLGSGIQDEYANLMHWFHGLWQRPQAHEYKTITDKNGKTKKIPFKEYLISEIQKIFIEYLPKDIYYKILFELFGSDLLMEKDNPEFNRKIGRLENTMVYKTLFEFQQKGVLSLIKMLQKHNGAILADAVGLGKTWSALAVMKFYQMQGYEIILICPKKLQNNWRTYLKNQNSKFEKDEFDYFIRFQTDLCPELLERYEDRADKYFINDKPKLFVIDESHNLRNDKSKRYKFLVEEILSKNDDVKVLLLSATPINNSLADIRNQFKLLVKGNPNGFEDSLDIKNIDTTFRTAKKVFNDWKDDENPNISEFIKKLPSNFFKLTDALTVARTRKMIKGHQDGLEFPIKERPENIFVTPDQIGNFESFEQVFDSFPPMLSAYQPSYYVDVFDDVSVLADEKQRDHFLVKMMYILLVKRLESSWYSFMLTADKLLAHQQKALDEIKRYEKTKIEYDWEPDPETTPEDDELYDIFNDFFLGKKRLTKLIDIENSGKIEAFKTDLNADIDALEKIKNNLDKFKLKITKETLKKNNFKSEDKKLEILMDRIISKRNNSINNNNQKVLIFTVYKDTAYYLYEQLKLRGFEKIAVVSGSGAKVWDVDSETNKFETILQRFAPFTKLYREKEWLNYTPDKKITDLNEQFQDWMLWVNKNDSKTATLINNQIDILIATDTLSEGQNLQDCDLVINYDIHWNPVRVIQRMGRIDRLGSPNKKIFGINFWPSDSINTYLNLQGRIEQRMATMKLVGSEVDDNFSETFRTIAEDENLDLRQKEKMIQQMQSSWDEIEVGDDSLGFDDLSLESFRQELLEKFKESDDFYEDMPNGIYSGFIKKSIECPEEGIIALLGFPKKTSNSNSHIYTSFELIYIDYEGKSVVINQKEILDAISKHKDEDRYVPNEITIGETATIEKLSYALKTWIRSQAITEVLQEDGTIKETIGTAKLDLINKLKQGSKAVLSSIKNDETGINKYTNENFDLITWLIVS